ncbi:MAG: ABC transporter permease [Actinobacteria bacterium]|nr:ABC transporter permease [Actinomycetota bacterium]
MAATTLVAWSRIRRSWGRLVLLGALAGVVAGLVVGAVAGERRTWSAASRLVAATDAPDAYVLVRTFEPGRVEQAGEVLEADRRVSVVWPFSQFIGRTTGAKDWYYPMAGPARPDGIARPLLVDGRMPADRSVDEVAISRQTAVATGLGVGDVIRMDLYTPQQMATIAEDTETEPQGSHLELRVVGVVRDAFDIAPAAADRLMVASPAFYDRHRASGDNEFRGFAVRARGGEAGMRQVASDLQRTPGLDVPGAIEVRPTSALFDRLAPANRVLRTGIWVLALVVAGIGSFVVAQAIRRHVDRHQGEHVALRAIGFTRPDGVAASTLPGLVAAVVAGVVAVAVAVAVSPLFPLGHPRVLEPSPGVHVDLPVVGLGAVLVVAWTLALFAVVAWLDLDPAPRVRRRTPSPALAWASSIAPPSVLLGLHLATDPSSVRRGVRARTAALGAALGIAGLVAATTFVASLGHLVATPVEYGIDYDLSIEVPESQVGTRLDELAADDRLEAVAEQRSTTVEVAGRSALAVSMVSRKGRVAPVLAEGRLPAGPDEALLGPALARSLGVGVGDTVQVGSGDRERRVTVVGTHLDPQPVSAETGSTLLLHPGTLAEVAPPDAPPYPMIVVRYADGADATAVTADLDRRYPYGVMDESFPSPPGTLLNLDAVRTVPVVLAWFFVGLTVVALANGVVATGRRARHTVGVVRGLGFTAAQVRTAMVSMGLLLAGGSLLVGVPLGAVVGAAAWSRVSGGLDIAPDVRWALGVLGAALVAVPGLGAVAALWPARTATLRSPAEVLRTE